jgi:hypothetical protein
MEEEKPKLESASFEFSQDGNCLVREDEAEFLTIECESSLGIDRDEDCFYVLKTKKWSIDSTKDLQELFDRINQVIINKTKNKIK